MLNPTHTVAHYENFPVASLLLPKQYRAAVASIYHFARYADDLADEGEMATEIRLKKLTDCEGYLHEIAEGKLPAMPLFQALMKTYQQTAFPLSLCADLLSAFKQDIVKVRYQDEAEVNAYCRRSANPVGRLLLHIVKQASCQNLALSDEICTALQLINFLQDIAIDYQKGRIYLPQSVLDSAKVKETDIAQSRFTPAFSAMMLEQVAEISKRLQAGALLGKTLHGRVGLEIRMIILGGKVILHKLQACQGNVFSYRPQLTRRDWFYMMYQALKNTYATK